MEDLQDDILTGRLLQYALGELDAPGRVAVEAQAAQSPAVRQELDELLAGVAVYAEAHSLALPTTLRERVLRNVLAEISTAPTAAVSAGPAMRVSASNHAAARPAAGAAPASRFGGWALAASVALLLSLAGNATLYSRWQRASADLLAARTSFAQATQVQERRYAATQEQLGVLRSPTEYKMVALAGTPAYHGAHARVLFSAATHRVYLDVQQLPALPAGKQYQLWALDQGKPVDAGMLTAATAAGDSLQHMKDVASAQAFAMTVEPAGGSADPTMDTMTVIGKM